NGPPSGGHDDKVIITNNHIVVTQSVAIWGVLVTGIANNGIVANNYFEGGNAPGGAATAIGIYTGTNWSVQNNRLYNCSSTKPLIDAPSANGVTGCIITGNVAVSCSAPIVSLTSLDATTMAYGNSGAGNNTLYTSGPLNVTGTGTFSGNLTTTAFFTAGWDGAGSAQIN